MQWNQMRYDVSDIILIVQLQTQIFIHVRPALKHTDSPQ